MTKEDEIRRAKRLGLELPDRGYVIRLRGTQLYASMMFGRMNSYGPLSDAMLYGTHYEAAKDVSDDTLEEVWPVEIKALDKLEGRRVLAMAATLERGYEYPRPDRVKTLEERRRQIAAERAEVLMVDGESPEPDALVRRLLDEQQQEQETTRQRGKPARRTPEHIKERKARLMKRREAGDA